MLFELEIAKSLVKRVSENSKGVVISLNNGTILFVSGNCIGLHSEAEIELNNLDFDKIPIHIIKGVVIDNILEDLDEQQSLPN